MAEREKPFHLDIDFDEALRRYIGTDPREIPAKKPKEPQKIPKRHPKPGRLKLGDVKAD